LSVVAAIELGKPDQARLSSQSILPLKLQPVLESSPLTLPRVRVGGARRAQTVGACRMPDCPFRSSDDRVIRPIKWCRHDRFLFHASGLFTDLDTAMTQQAPREQGLSTADCDRCDRLAELFAYQEWESENPTRMSNKTGFDRLVHELGSWDIADNVSPLSQIAIKY
jgi:hypothetical protein